ncbi:hypothetical protein VFPPC_16463 [Pochonia chlamydosporia 170]|uniref:Uncharacterized protein n=1 Tax=Pochonia chlamydosporia 170 TaxID=1380566 RepID=A0A179FDI2_METCM|nr:hypothetical protein VFPPC_16463 [Pochonia chlamydosporia 170]OAQ63351.1 hypothetical protein VFPPC_16463 [Pochonia chlamydosporia 170]
MCLIHKAPDSNINWPFNMSIEYELCPRLHNFPLCRVATNGMFCTPTRLVPATSPNPPDTFSSFRSWDIAEGAKLSRKWPGGLCVATVPGLVRLKPSRRQVW